MAKPYAGTRHMQAHGVYAEVFRGVATGDIDLPSLPNIALRIRDAMADKNYDVQKIARIVAADPAVSAHLVHLANSPLYRTRVKVDSVKTAVSRFGAVTTRNLVTTYVLRSLYRTRTAALGRLLHEIWKESCEVSAIAAVLASRCPGFDPDNAMLAGLLCNIGALPLVSVLEKRADLQDDEAAARAVIEEYSARSGALLLTAWEFDPRIVEVARSRADWLRDPGPSPDLADIVLVAQLHNYVRKQIPGHPRLDTVPAFVKLPLGKLSPEFSIELLDAAYREIQEVMQVLRGV